MITKEKLSKIKNQYGTVASWAIWDEKDESDVSIIEKKLSKLHTNWVIIGLNISKKVNVWGNFRAGRHDRKLKIAFNHTDIAGAYMTDLIKIIKTDSNEILKQIKNGSIKINEQVENLRKELDFVGINDKSKFIVFGNIARIIYDDYYEKYYPNNKVFYLKHYSGRYTDKQWVEEVWRRLNINLNFKKEYNRYQK